VGRTFDVGELTRRDECNMFAASTAAAVAAGSRHKQLRACQRAVR